MKLHCKRLSYALATTAVIAASVALADKPPDPAGTWTWYFMPRRASRDKPPNNLILKWEGDKLSGTFRGTDGVEDPIRDVTYKNGELSFVVTRKLEGHELTFEYRGRVSENEIVGKSTALRSKNVYGWKANRLKQKDLKKPNPEPKGSEPPKR